MTLKELISEMKKLNDACRYVDKENVHIDIDDLLLAYINNPDVKEQYHRITKWYS